MLQCETLGLRVESLYLVPDHIETQLRNLGPRGRASCSGLRSCRNATEKTLNLGEELVSLDQDHVETQLRNLGEELVALGQDHIGIQLRNHGPQGRVTQIM